MAFLLNKTSLSKLRLNPPQVNEASMLTKRAIHIEPGAREKALLAADPSLKRFKSHKQSVRTLKRVGDVLTIVVVADGLSGLYMNFLLDRHVNKKSAGNDVMEA